MIEVHPKGWMPIWMSGVLEQTPLRFYARWMRPPFESRFDARGVNWVVPWMLTVPAAWPNEVVAPLALVAAVVVLLAVRRRRYGRGGSGGEGYAAWPLLWFAVPCGMSACFWLWAGPDGRYAWPFLWTLAAAFLAVPAARWRPGWVLAGVLALASLPIGYKAATLLLLRRQNPLAELPFIPPGPDHGMQPRPQMGLELVETSGGAAVWVPVEDVLVWHPKLPSSGWPELNDELSLREPGNLAAGFVTGEAGR